MIESQIFSCPVGPNSSKEHFQDGRSSGNNYTKSMILYWSLGIVQRSSQCCQRTVEHGENVCIYMKLQLKRHRLRSKHLRKNNVNPSYLWFGIFLLPISLIQLCYPDFTLSFSYLCQLGAYNAKLFTDFSVIDRFVKDLEVITIVSSKLYLCYSLSLPETT